MAKAENTELVQARRASPAGGRRPTIEMVAELAGVSRQTVSERL